MGEGRTRNLLLVVSLIALFLPVTLSMHHGVFGAAPAVAYALEIGQTIGNIMLNIASIITYFGGMLLQYCIDKFVIGIGELTGSGGTFGIAIEQIWVVVRDISNLLLIFGLIYVGIATIISPDRTSTKQFLSRIIIAALLINFSLFITRAVIDVSGYISTEMYRSMLSADGSISETIVTTLGITEFYKPITKDGQDHLTSGGSVAFFFMAALFLIVTGFVFAAGAILLIVRFVALIFIMIFSPLLFSATIFPKTASLASSMWHKLFSYAFFAPAYLFLLILSIHILQALMKPLGTDGKFMSDAVAGQQDAFSVLGLFTVAIMFMIFALKASQQFGMAGANGVVGAAQVGMGAATAGLAARAGRATAGRFGNRLASSGKLRDAASAGGVRGFLAKQTLKGSHVVADSSFDARNANKKFSSKIGVGEGRKGGFRSVQDEVKKKEADFAKNYLGEVGDDDPKVKERKAAVDANNRLIAEKKIELEDERDEVKKKEIRAKIRELEDEKKVLDDSLKREKNRRVLGAVITTADRDKTKSLNKQIELQEQKIADIKKERAQAATDADRDRLARAQGQYESELTRLKKEHKEHSTYIKNAQAGGYAGVLENSKWWNSWPAGKMVTHEKNAGVEMRKAYEKLMGTSKEDQAHKELVEEIKRSKAT